MTTATELSREQKHALIAQFMGWTDIHAYGTGQTRGRNLAPKGVLVGHRPDLPEMYDIVPDYSSDDAPRSLLARVEAKLAEMGQKWKEEYISQLFMQMGKHRMFAFDYRHNLYRWEIFRIATAPASARVDALVAVIREIATAQN